MASRLLKRWTRAEIGTIGAAASVTDARSPSHHSDCRVAYRGGGRLMGRYIGVLIACGLLFLSPNLAAQQNATVQGIVVDESKGVMPGAMVTASEIGTGRESVAVTTEDGRYRLENLPPGKYKL